MADDNKLFREEFNVSSLLRLVYQQGERQTCGSSLLSDGVNRFLMGYEVRSFTKFI